MQFFSKILLPVLMVSGAKYGAHAKYRAHAKYGDWVNEMRLTLANYALAKAANPPVGFVCSVVGTKHNSCHCWNMKGSNFIFNIGYRILLIEMLKI